MLFLPMKEQHDQIHKRLERSRGIIPAIMSDRHIFPTGPGLEFAENDDPAPCVVARNAVDIPSTLLV
jgi:hypothetical protein